MKTGFTGSAYQYWSVDDLVSEMQKKDDRIKSLNRRLRKLKTAVRRIYFSYGKAQSEDITSQLEEAMK